MSSSMYKQADQAVDTLVNVLRKDNSPEYVIGFLNSLVTGIICRLPPEVTEREINIINTMSKQIVDDKEMQLRWK